jgi:crossover junction endodeoxyribonuclease RuvC
MKILGIDPGYERCGVAIIEKPTHGKEVVIFSDCLRTSSKLPLEKRLHAIGRDLEQLILQFQPDCAAIEELYFAKNTTTAMQVAEARGVIRYILESNTIPCTEYHPNKIKIAITGHGGANKSDLSIMIPRLITLDLTKKLDDELDAIAVALTHAAHMRNNYPQVTK